jgi:hypothetical protein
MLRIALLLAAAVAAAGCQQQQLQQQEQRANRKVIGKDAAIEIARRHVAEASPGLDISQKPPTAEFVLDQEVMGGQIWRIEFAYPAPKGPDGKIEGVRPYIGLTVWVLPDGRVRGIVSHTP